MMTDINELNIPDPKKDELNRRRQSRIAEIEAMPDDDPVEADKLLGAVDKSQIIKLLSEFRQILNGGRLKK